jgi:DNA-binding NtrC family response regulator
MVDADGDTSTSGDDASRPEVAEMGVDPDSRSRDRSVPESAPNWREQPDRPSWIGRSTTGRAGQVETVESEQGMVRASAPDATLRVSGPGTARATTFFSRQPRQIGMETARILVVDDEPAMLENCERSLSRAGYACFTLAEPMQFRARSAELKPDVIITDIRMPGADGMTLLAAAVADEPDRPVILITAFASVASAVEAIRAGAFDYLTKPFTSNQLLVAVDRAVRFRQLARENKDLRQRVARSPVADGFLGSSAVVTRLLEQVRKVAPSDANVLLTGESGTGKELVARIIHARSDRANGPFVPVDCAALPEGLLESELFGHERGAFTGAVGRKKGLLVQADGGTFFLDELAELSPGLQSKLLRVLEERQVRPVGSTQHIGIDVRLVGATNTRLDEAVEAGRFRQDLYYRLNVVQFVIPALRERVEDVPILMRSFLERYAAANGKATPRVAGDVWPVLERYEWPGNVRELRNLAERLVVLDEDGRIEVADLPDAMTSLQHFSSPTLAGPTDWRSAQAEAMQAFRGSYVQHMLRLHDGNVSKAARAAGVSRRTFHRWLAEPRTAHNGSE